jgi:hypothetical protein
MNAHGNFKFFHLFQNLLDAGPFDHLILPESHFDGVEAESREFKETIHDHKVNGHIKICTWV